MRVAGMLPVALAMGCLKGQPCNSDEHCVTWRSTCDLTQPQPEENAAGTCVPKFSSTDSPQGTSSSSKSGNPGSLGSSTSSPGSVGSSTSASTPGSSSIDLGSSSSSAPGSSSAPSSGGVSSSQMGSSSSADPCLGCAGCCANGVCHAPMDNAFCGPPAGACTDCGVGNTCLPGGRCSCGNGPACAAGELCVGGTCMCGPGAACVAGQACVGDTCICDITTCPNGCCQGNVCIDPTTVNACQIDGKDCEDCGLRASACIDGQCRCGGGNGCQDGQRCEGGACICDVVSCPAGCCDGNGRCQTGDGKSSCGAGGKVCQSCQGMGNDCEPGASGGGACITCLMTCLAGCCSGTDCLAPSMTSCGPVGSVCTACDPERSTDCDATGCRCGAGVQCAINQQCQDGVCVSR